MLIRKQTKEVSTVWKGGVALGLIIGLAVGILLSMGWEKASGFPILNDPGSLTSLVAALAAASSAALALFALQEQRKSRQAGTDPVLIAHLSQRRDAPVLIQLSVSNVGAGAAVNVRVSPSRPDGHEKKKLLSNLFELSHPIQTILQSQSVDYPLQTGPTLFADPTLPPFEVDLSYDDIDGNSYSGTFEIDVMELYGRGANKAPDALIAEHLEKVSDSLRRLGKSNNPFSVLTQTVEQKRAQEQAWVEEIKRQKDGN